MENSPKSIRCKAAVCRAPGEPLVIEEVEVAPPKAFEVRIKIICTSLCHIDLTFWTRQDMSIFCPRILGHEAFGIIESLGDPVLGGSRDAAGQPVNNFLGVSSFSNAGQEVDGPLEAMAIIPFRLGVTMGTQVAS